MTLGTGAFKPGTQFPGVLLDLLAVPGILGSSQVHTNIACGGTSTVVWSNSFPLHRGMLFGWEVALTSSVGVAVTIELEQGNQPPTTEGAIDGSWCIPYTKTGSSGLFPTGTIVAPGVTYIAPYAPVPTILGRLKITPTSGNDTSTVLTLARVYQIKEV